MSFREDLPNPSPSPEDNPDESSYPILDACDELALARNASVYLEALERYIYQNLGSGETTNQILQFLNLYRFESKRGLDKVASLLKRSLKHCDCGRNDG